MKSQVHHDPRSGLSFDLLGSAIALAIVWGAFSMLFGEPTKVTTVETAAPVEISASFDIYDSVMTDDEDWQMLAVR